MTKPCKHPKGDRYVKLRPKIDENGAFMYAGNRFLDELVTYCTKCGKKLREVEVKE